MSVRTIPNAIDTAVFAPRPKAEARTRLGLPQDRKLVLFAGANTQDPRKGFSVFKEAIDTLRIQQQELEVLVCGKSRADAYRDMAVHVHDLGTLSDPERVVQAYAAADLLVVSSLEDNLPNTVMEAMACGTPVVGVNVGGIPEMLEHQHNGYLAGYRSAASIAEGIRWVLDHNPTGELSAHARHKVTEYLRREGGGCAVL